MFEGHNINPGVVAATKRLIFESHTLVVADLKQKVEKGEDVGAVTMAPAEREHRVTAQRARLTACIRKCGMLDSFQIDTKGEGSSCPAISLDLSTEAGQAHFMNLIDEPSLLYVHWAPPCGTASRARLIQYEGAPEILRTDLRPHGVPGLKGISKLRVSQANRLYAFTVKACRALYSRGVLFSVENPLRSFTWFTKRWRSFFKDVPVFQTTFHHCMYEGSRRKATLLVHVLPSYLVLRRPCDNSHPHAGWGRVGNKWATAEETAYPWALAKAMAAQLREQLLLLGCKDCNNSLDQVEESVAGARAFAGAQAGKRVLPLVPEFKRKQGIVAKSTLSSAWSVPASSLASASECSSIPAGSKVLHIQTSRGQTDVPNPKCPDLGPGCFFPPAPSPLGSGQDVGLGLLQPRPVL